MGNLWIGGEEATHLAQVQAGRMSTTHRAAISCTALGSRIKCDSFGTYDGDMWTGVDKSSQMKKSLHEIRDMWIDAALAFMSQGG
jgi:hypothetical protein